MSTSDQRVALVTGANRGIGLACALSLRDAGFVVVGTYRTEHPDHDDIVWVQCDVTDRDSVDAAFGQVESTVGNVSVLVSNAGITNDKLLMEMDTADFMSVVEANLGGSFLVAQRAVQKMSRARWGRIIFMSSISGRAGQAGQANYAASKAGLIGFARSLAKEYAKRKITFNVVAPGPIETDMLGDVPEDTREKMREVVPLQRFGDVSEVASAVCWLASDGAAYTTGAVIPVDGGLFMSA